VNLYIHSAINLQGKPFKWSTEDGINNIEELGKLLPMDL
jgi:hypothetical protein